MVRIKVDANNMIAKEQIKTKELEKQVDKLSGKSDRGLATIKFESDQEELARSKTITKATPKTEESAAKVKKFAEKLSLNRRHMDFQSASRDCKSLQTKD
ncbi:MAG: hypothetical protein ACYSQZ_01655 [Planctomycetota bacterium]|jgi:hypothetical protein